jgi:hypothetical protein
MHFPSIYFGCFSLDRPIKSSKVKMPTPVGTSPPGVAGALPVIPFGALNRNPSNPAAWKGKWRKALSRNKKTGFHTWNRENTKIKNQTQKSACHVSTNSRPVRNLFFKFRIWWAVRSKLGKRGPSDQNMPRVNVPRVNIFLPYKRYEPIGDCHVASQATTWRVKYITSIRDHRNKIFKKVQQNFAFCDRTFYNKSKTGRFQTDVSWWTCGNPKLKLRTRGNSKQATWT